MSPHPGTSLKRLHAGLMQVNPFPYDGIRIIPKIKNSKELNNVGWEHGFVAAQSGAVRLLRQAVPAAGEAP